MIQGKWTLSEWWTELEYVAGRDETTARLDRALYYTGAAAVIEILMEGYRQGIAPEEMLFIFEGMMMEIEELPMQGRG